MENREYNIGLDIGTSSVGWAVVDRDSNKLIKKGNKTLWGSRLFEEGQTAAERREYRSTRRRYHRRKERIRLLREEFALEINKVDPNFFQKLTESFYHEDDEKNKTIKITKDEKKLVKEYHKKYPTIYHLRKELLENNEKKDIRLVYLAIHHLIKYRGNFLYSNKEFSVEHLDIHQQLKNCFENMDFYFSKLEIDTQNINYKELSEILLFPSKLDKQKEIKRLLKDMAHQKFIMEFAKMMVGNSFSVVKLFSLEVDEDQKLSFKGNSMEDNYDNLLRILGDSMDALVSFKELYDMLFLKELFQGDHITDVSNLMVKKYNQHHEDLMKLKDYFRPFPTEYAKIFKSKRTELCIFERYVNRKLSYEDFKNKLIQLVDKVLLDQTSETYRKIKELLNKDGFLTFINDVDNGKLPYQLNKQELVKIIKNQGKYYPFLLNKKDDDYRIVRLLEFRIPYYIGPLNKASDKAWLIRREGKITPYNFNEMVNFDASAENFILRMISHCTYLLDEYVIPNNSILYSKFKVLNELKQIRIDDKPLTNEVQHRIFNELFLKNDKKINEKLFKNYLVNQCGYYPEMEITGYSDDKKFANDMSSYVDFFGINGFFKDLSYNEDNAEEIISWLTIFEDKDIVKRKLNQQYPLLNNHVVNRILSKKYKGWSRLSKKLLTEVCYKDPRDSRSKSIMTLMEETSKNFMQIINDKEYGFEEKIANLNSVENARRMNYKMVENLATSPATKRSIYQALKVVEELVDYMGYKPSNIMIEMSRTEGVKKRKDDRKKYLTKLYDKHKKDIQNYSILKQELNRYEKISHLKLFLYFIQEGKSLYSGEPLNIQDLDSYEIDHILPRTLVKDDSIDNKALVKKEENQIKGASLVLPEKYRGPKSQALWNHLEHVGLISKKKYGRLKRKCYSDSDIEGFIHRQLVETRQITKHVAHILENHYQDIKNPKKSTKVIYLHANLSHNYREKYELYKFRQLNDFHHAHDAYLAAVLGEYQKQFRKDKVGYQTMKNLSEIYYKNKEYDKMRYGYVVNSLDANVVNVESGEIIFDEKKDQFNKLIENTLYQNDVLISKKTEIKTGAFYDQTKYSPKDNKSGFPLKNNLDIEKYGNYSRVMPAYAIVVKYTKKGKEKQKIIGIPIIIDAQDKTKKGVKKAYIRNLLKLEKDDEIMIVKDYVPFHITMNWDGQICSLVGATDKIEVTNAKEFMIEKEKMKIWKKTLARLLNNQIDVIDDITYEQQLCDILKYILDKMQKYYKLYEELIVNNKELIIEKANNVQKLESTITEFLKLLRGSSQGANLKSLDKTFSMAFGKKANQTVKHAILINKSITGLKEHHYEF